MSLKQRIRDEMKSALKAGDKQRLAAIRMAVAAITQREIDDRSELDDSGVIRLIEKMVKQRRESIQQYKKGNREDLADKEQSEIDVLRGYLPEPMTDAELASLIDQVIRETGAESMRDMGQVMGQIKARAQGRGDMSVISAKVRERLA